MRACRHCSHENADHLSYCSRCGRRLASGAYQTLEAGARGRGTGRGPLTSAALSPTMVSAPSGVARSGSLPSAGRTGAATLAITASGIPAEASRTAPIVRSRLGWAGESIGYIYVYLRGKLDAGERRKRLTEERVGAEALLSGAINELALGVLREGISHPDLTGLLEAIGRAQARREAAAADMAASDGLQQAEATRLGAQEASAEKAWAAADRAARDADEILRAATGDRRTAETRLDRVRDDRARLDREAAGAGAALDPVRAAELAHDASGLAGDERALQEQVARLDRELADLRAKAAGLREAAGAAKGKHETAVGARRQAASAMAASIAGRQRDRADAEREVADLTNQLGRATAEVRPPHTALLSGYQTIDRLVETIGDRTAQLAALEQARGAYDQRKLLTGVGLLTSVLLASAALLWVVLR
jgi:hypothetical protein